MRNKAKQPELKRIRALFTLQNAGQQQHYTLTVTDPAWDSRLSALPEGDYPQDAGVLKLDARILLTISLSEPFGEERKCHKLVAAVIVVPMQLRG